MSLFKPKDPLSPFFGATSLFEGSQPSLFTASLFEGSQSSLFSGSQTSLFSGSQTSLFGGCQVSQPPKMKEPQVALSPIFMGPQS
jgi:hypothetical protein